MVTSNRAFESGRAEAWRVLGLLLRRRAAQRELLACTWTKVIGYAHEARACC